MCTERRMPTHGRTDARTLRGPKAAALAIAVLCVGASARPCERLRAQEHREGPRPPGAQWNVHSWSRPRPPVVDPGPERPPVPPPADAIVLFDGKDLSEWRAPDGAPPKKGGRDAHAGGGPGARRGITRRRMGDGHLHPALGSPTHPPG